MHRICASVLALGLLVTSAWAQSALPAGGKAGVAKAKTISTFWVTTAGVGLLGAGAFLISTMHSSTSSAVFSGGNGETVLTGSTTTTTTTTTS